MDEKTLKLIDPKNLPVFRIRVKGHLKRDITDEFKSMMVCYSEGNTHLVGPIADESLLYHLILKLHHLGCGLLSVEPVTPNLSSEKYI